MKKNLLFIAIAFLMGMGGTMAQSKPGRVCGTMEYLQEQLKNDPAMRSRMEQIEQQTQNYILSNAANRSTAVISIPVVFHVLYSTNNTTQNVPDARILEQLHVLNLDYSHTNADAGNAPAPFLAVAANTNIQFCLAQQDPGGAATTGIIRKQTATTSFSQNNAVKFNAQGGDDAWNSAKYMNVWICNLGGGLLGYAQFPGGTASTDGIVVLNESVGGPAAVGTMAPYDLGRTLTHEVGHWLNLSHIWGDANCGNDQVGDTPTQQTSNFGCPTYPHVTCSNGPNGDMFMNYMDYVDDGCMNMFTAGQSTRSNALFAAGGARVGITTSQGCVAVGGVCGTPTNLSAQAITSSGASLYWTAVSGGTTYYIQYRVSGTTTWTPVNTTNTSIALTGLTANTTYDYRVSAFCSTTYGAYTAINTFTTAATTGCGVPAVLSITGITPTKATFNLGAVSGATKYNVSYRISGNTAWLSKTVTTTTVALTNLFSATVYNYRVRAYCTAWGAYSAIQNFTTSPLPTACTGVDYYESNNTLAAAATIAPNTNIYPLISSATDKDYFKVTTTSAAPKLKVDVDGLPGDYDVQLYLSSTGALLSSSANASTTPEQIIYNTATAGTVYKVYVFGYGGAFSAANCYHLRVSTSASNFREMGSHVEQNGQAGIMSLYPNPANDQLNINLLSDKNQTSMVNVVDMLGRTVLNIQKALTEGANKLNVDLGNLQNGIYSVSVNINGKNVMQKLVIQKN